MKSINEIYNYYLELGGKGDATSFGIWLIKNTPELEQVSEIPSQDSAMIPSDSLTAILVGKLERFIHVELKTALKKIGLSNQDEFALMSTLHFMGQTTKTSLLKQCVFEITTGSQMLKRLIEYGYITQINNPKDGRSSLIQLSQKGQNKLYEGFEELNKIKNLTEGLSEGEKKSLNELLQHLDQVHSKRQKIKTIVDVIENR
jgi:DNA-binding MarR family transcriptional regulator